MNKVTVSGNLVRDAEFKEIKEGMFLCSFTVLVESEVGPTDNRRLEKLYVPCKAWNKVAQACSDLKEGSTVQVEGRLKYEQWENKDGEKRSKWIIIAREVIRQKSEAIPDNSSGLTFDELPF